MVFSMVFSMFFYYKKLDFWSKKRDVFLLEIHITDYFSPDFKVDFIWYFPWLFLEKTRFLVKKMWRFPPWNPHQDLIFWKYFKFFFSKIPIWKHFDFKCFFRFLGKSIPWLQLGFHNFLKKSFLSKIPL